MLGADRAISAASATRSYGRRAICHECRTDERHGCGYLRVRSRPESRWLGAEPGRGTATTSHSLAPARRQSLAEPMSLGDPAKAGEPGGGAGRQPVALASFLSETSL